MKRLMVIGILIAGCFLFAYAIEQKKEDHVPIPPSKQRSGDAAKGYQYLITGDYLKSGIPYSFFKLVLKNDSSDLQNTTITGFGNQGLFW